MNLKPAFDRFIRWLILPSLLLCGLALVDFVLHPLAPDFTYHSALYRAVTLLLFTPLSLLVGFLIMRRVPGNVAGPLLIVWAGTVVFGAIRRDIGLLPFALFSFYEMTIGWSALFLFVAHYPDGKIYPPRAAPWFYGSFGLSVLLGIVIFFSDAHLYAGLANPFTVPALQNYGVTIALLAIVAFAPGWGLVVISPVLRYRKGSRLERQQIKWLALFGGLLVIASILGGVVYPLLTGGQVFGRENNLFSLIFFSSVNLFPPLIIGLAVLRYHLWDIDILIRKTLVYGTLTAALALVFFGGVALLQQILGKISGTEDSPVAVVLLTLAIAALFNPLRQRIQDFIDRRFYRHKYDAEKALAAFNAAARSQVELKPLADQLVVLVDNTLQPARISLWLRDE